MASYKDTLLEFPCPARATLASSSDDAGNEDCTLEHGVLPWRTLALAENVLQIVPSGPEHLQLLFRMLRSTLFWYGNLALTG